MFLSFLTGFPVTTRLTPSSEKIGIRDDYTMYITDEFVAIHEIETSKLVVQWPIIGLRGWKSEPAGVAGRAGTHLLTLEAGRYAEDNDEKNDNDDDDNDKDDNDDVDNDKDDNDDGENDDDDDESWRRQ